MRIRFRSSIFQATFIVIDNILLIQESVACNTVSVVCPCVAAVKLCYLPSKVRKPGSLSLEPLLQACKRTLAPITALGSQCTEGKDPVGASLSVRAAARPVLCFVAVLVRRWMYRRGERRRKVKGIGFLSPKGNTRGKGSNKGRV